MAGLDLPVVMVTGHGDEETAVQAFKLGASDYVVKGEGYLTRLPPTVEPLFGPTPTSPPFPRK